MFDIEFWEDKKDYSDVADYIENLSKKSDKDSRVNLRKIVAYITGNKIVILSHFIKKTNKTPKAEIEKAKKRLEEYKEKYK